MTDEQVLIAEIHKLPDDIKSEAVNEALKLIKALAKQPAADQTPKRRRPKAGMYPGMFKMSPDFDDPLEEFEEYM